MTDSYVSYISRKGRIISATCTTAGKTEFYRDAVGSVVMTTNYNSPIGKSQRFAAYGKELTPNSYYSNYRMGWVGSLGYRETNLNHAEQYIRARHYSSTEARWSTVDPLWPSEFAYIYVMSDPAGSSDPAGLGEPPLPKPKNFKCPKGYKPVFVTCYGKDAQGGGGISHPGAPGCGGKCRPPRVGDCATDSTNPKCPVGSPVTIIITPGRKLHCRVCDGGQGHGGIDIFRPISEKDCWNHFPSGWKCIKCS